MRDATGERLLTRTDVSVVTESLWAEYTAARDRRLDDIDVVYLFLDAVFDGILAVWGILRDGRRVVLHLAMGSRESHENWLEFLRDMVWRGLGVPLSITTDGAPGLIAAVEAMWPKSIRCWAHYADVHIRPIRSATSWTRSRTRCAPRSRPTSLPSARQQP